MTDEELQNLNEAPASVNFYGVTSKGWNIQITLRDVNWKNLMHEFSEMTQWLEKNKVLPKAIGGQPSPPASISAEAHSTAERLIEELGYSLVPELPKETSPLPGVLAGSGDTEAQEKNFDADLLTLKIEDGNTYYKIKGGRFSKFGVTIWPEVIEEAGIDPAKLDPTKTYNLKHRAWYVEKDGKPHKVTRLVKIG